MSDTNIAPAGSDSASAPVTAPTPASEALTPREAHQAYTARRDKVASAPAPKEPETAEAPNELAEEASAAPPQEVPGEAPPEVEPAVEPPIERPRSWTKDEDAEWQSLPRAMQQKIVAREQERDTGLRRSQNEAAEKLKGLTAKEQAVEQSRQQYEAALPALLQQLQSQQQGEFSDIKTEDDWQRLSVEDPARFVRFQARQMLIASAAERVTQAQDRQAKEFETKWSEFARSQDNLVAEHVPEIADPVKAQKIADGGLALLKELGFSDQEIPQLWQGKASISLRDARIQRLLIDGVRYREAKTNAAKPVPKTAPPVQRPGVAQPKGSAADANVQALRNKLNTSGETNDAYALYQARKKAAGS